MARELEWISPTRCSRAEMCELPIEVRCAVNAARASAVRWGSGGGGVARVGEDGGIVAAMA